MSASAKRRALAQPLGSWADFPGPLDSLTFRGSSILARRSASAPVKAQLCSRAAAAFCRPALQRLTEPAAASSSSRAALPPRAQRRESLRSAFNPPINMLSSLRYVGAALLVFSLRSLVLAQAGFDAQAVADAVALRQAMVDNILNGSEKPAAALDRLKALRSPSGLKIDREVDIAMGAIDVGHRLIASGRPAEAELFYRAAERSLTALVDKTPDSQAQAKAQYLENLSFIRAHCLNDVAQARLDIERAIALQPDDNRLQSARQNLAREHAEFFKNPPAK
jgi:hypothetical protein